MKRICQYEYTFPSDETSPVQHVALLNNKVAIVMYDNRKYQTFDVVEKKLLKTGDLPVKKHNGKVEIISQSVIFITDDLEKKGFVFDIENDKVLHGFDGPLSPSSTYSDCEIWRIESQLSSDKSKIFVIEDVNNSYVLKRIDIANGFETKTKEINSSNKDFTMLVMNNDKVLLYPNSCEKGLIEFIIVDYQNEAPRTFNVQTNVTENFIFIMKTTHHDQNLYFWANNNYEMSYPSCFVVELPRTTEGDATFIGERKLNFPNKDGTNFPCYNFYDTYYHDPVSDLTIVEICDAVGIKIATINIGNDKEPSKLYNTTPILDNDGHKIRTTHDDQIIQWELEHIPADSGIQFKIFRSTNLAVTVISLLNNLGVLEKFSEGTVKNIVEKFKTSFDVNK